MQFLFNVLFVRRGGGSGGGEDTRADTSVIIIISARTVTTGRFQWLPKRIENGENPPVDDFVVVTK